MGSLLAVIWKTKTVSNGLRDLAQESLRQNLKSDSDFFSKCVIK